MDFTAMWVYRRVPLEKNAILSLTGLKLHKEQKRLLVSTLSHGLNYSAFRGLASPPVKTSVITVLRGESEWPTSTGWTQRTIPNTTVFALIGELELLLVELDLCWAPGVVQLLTAAV